MRISVWSSDVCSFKLSSCQRSSDRQPAERSIRGGWARSAVFAQRRFQWRHAGWDRLLPGYATQRARSEEHTSELQSLMRISYAVFCLKKKRTNQRVARNRTHKLLKNRDTYNISMSND